jgi:hypothetical protein
LPDLRQTRKQEFDAKSPSIVREFPDSIVYAMTRWCSLSHAASGDRTAGANAPRITKIASNTERLHRSAS